MSKKIRNSLHSESKSTLSTKLPHSLMNVLSGARLKAVCFLADDRGHSESYLAQKIGMKPSNFSQKVMKPLEENGYVIDGEIERTRLPGRPRKLKNINPDSGKLVNILNNLNSKIHELEYDLPEYIKTINKYSRLIADASQRNVPCDEIEKLREKRDRTRVKYNNLKTDYVFYRKAFEKLRQKLDQVLLDIDTQESAPKSPLS